MPATPPNNEPTSAAAEQAPKATGPTGATGRPLTDQPGEAYVLSVRFAAGLARELDALREAYFPPERNFLPAHLTLFHALPGGRLRHVVAELSRAAAATPPLTLAFVGPFDLGRGVALRVRSPGLEALRARLATAFADLLTAQDAAKFRAHVTVQNKVAPAEARRTLHALEMAWNPDYVGTATGLTLARYAHGPWAHLADFAFTGERAEAAGSAEGGAAPTR